MPVARYCQSEDQVARLFRYVYTLWHSLRRLHVGPSRAGIPWSRPKSFTGGDRPVDRFGQPVVTVVTTSCGLASRLSAYEPV